MDRHPLTYGSLCSGLSGESVAWGPLGWQARWFAEVDPVACSVLRHHYPEVINHGDVARLEAPAPVTTVVGGTPCQSFSVGGGRKGLADPRGQLSLHFVRIVEATRPRLVVWENVPGVLSSNDGRDFGAFLGALGECGYGWCYRILDLRGFRMDQRRRRVWLVAYRGDHAPAAAVLFPPGQVAEAPRPDGDGRSADSAGDPGLGRPWGHVITGDKTPKIGDRWIPTLRAAQGGEGVVLWTEQGPRRLTPREYERAQGYPDDYTLVPYRGRMTSDAQRRKMLGNTFPPPVLRWIGSRIQAWEDEQGTEEATL